MRKKGTCPSQAKKLFQFGYPTSSCIHPAIVTHHPQVEINIKQSSILPSDVVKLILWYPQAKSCFLGQVYHNMHLMRIKNFKDISWEYNHSTFIYHVSVSGTFNSTFFTHSRWGLHNKIISMQQNYFHSLMLIEHQILFQIVNQFKENN